MKVYGSKPISVCRPGGPIEPAGDGACVLHEGRYAYTDVHVYGQEPGSSPFEKWLGANKLPVLSTDTATAVITGAPYFTNYEFAVGHDVTWPRELRGLPSWLPRAVTLEQFLGAANPPPPDDSTTWIAAAAAFALVVLGILFTRSSR